MREMLLILCITGKNIRRGSWSLSLCKQNKCLFFRGQRWFRTFPPSLAFTCNSKMSDRELTGHLHHLVLRHNTSDVRSVWKLNSFCVFVCALFHFFQMLMMIFPFIYLNIIPLIPPHPYLGYVWCGGDGWCSAPNQVASNYHCSALPVWI